MHLLLKVFPALASTSTYLVAVCFSKVYYQ